MTRLDIRLFDANLADRAVLREYYELMVSCAADWSDEAPSEYDAAIERLRNPAPGLGPFVQWAAYLDDRLIGFEKIGFPEQENSHIATVLQRLLIDTVEPGLWDVDAPAGYHAVSWIGRAPGGLVASYARARGAMDDAPLEDSTYRSPR
jgi:hypothetical protein